MIKIYSLVLVLLHFTVLYAQFNNDSLIIGSFGVGPEDSPQYYFGSSETNSFVDSYEKDTFHFNAKFVKVLLNTPDYWITYGGPARPFNGKSNIVALTNFNNI